MNLFLGNRREGALRGGILPNEPVGIFIKPSFPRRIGMGKEESGVEVLGDKLVMSEFLLVVRVQRGQRDA